MSDDELAALVVVQLRAPRCPTCRVPFDVGALVRVIVRGQPCIHCGERAPLEARRSRVRLTVGDDGWPKVVPLDEV